MIRTFDGGNDPLATFSWSTPEENPSEFAAAVNGGRRAPDWSSPGRRTPYFEPAK